MLGMQETPFKESRPVVHQRNTGSRFNRYFFFDRSAASYSGFLPSCTSKKVKKEVNPAHYASRYEVKKLPKKSKNVKAFVHHLGQLELY